MNLVFLYEGEALKIFTAAEMVSLPPNLKFDWGASTMGYYWLVCSFCGQRTLITRDAFEHGEAKTIKCHSLID